MVILFLGDTWQASGLQDVLTEMSLQLWPVSPIGWVWIPWGKSRPSVDLSLFSFYLILDIQVLPHFPQPVILSPLWTWAPESCSLRAQNVQHTESPSQAIVLLSLPSLASVLLRTAFLQESFLTPSNVSISSLVYRGPTLHEIP